MIYVILIILSFSFSQETRYLDEIFSDIVKTEDVGAVSFHALVLAESAEVRLKYT